MAGEGIGVEAIDDAMQRFGWPLGPLSLIDKMGIDASVDMLSELTAAFPNRIAIAPMLHQMREQGLTGRNGGAGFYVYRDSRARLNKKLALKRRKKPPSDEIQKRLMKAMIAEAKRCLDEQIITVEDDIDVATIFGMGFPQLRGGLVTYARHAGLWA